MHIGDKVPFVVFKKRVRDESLGGDNPFKWVDVTSEDLFAGKRVVIFSLPGAFTPTCSTYQVPGFVEHRAYIKSLDVDEIYVVSVNDTFVMRKWMIDQDALDKIDFIPDGSGTFTSGMGMLVRKDNLGFGARSWRYAAVVNDGIIEKFFEEPGRQHDCPEDPYGETSRENVIKYLESC